MGAFKQAGRLWSRVHSPAKVCRGGVALVRLHITRCSNPSLPVSRCTFLRLQAQEGNPTASEPQQFCASADIRWKVEGFRSCEQLRKCCPPLCCKTVASLQVLSKPKHEILHYYWRRFPRSNAPVSWRTFLQLQTQANRERPPSPLISSG